VFFSVEIDAVASRWSSRLVLMEAGMVAQIRGTPMCGLIHQGIAC